MSGRGWLAALAALALATAAAAQTMPPPGGAGDVDIPAARRAVDLGTQAPGVTGLAPPVAQAGAVDPNRYVLGPGDVLLLRERGRVMREETCEVSPEGLIVLPELPPLQVAGLTLAQARSLALARLGQVFRGVETDLRLLRVRRFRVFVTGSVKRAGPVEVPATTRASEVLADAGLEDGASRRNVVVRHRDGREERVDLDRLERAGDASVDPLLLDGDVVQVPAMVTYLSANGAVARPGRYELAPGDSLATLLRLAGGALPAADSAQALLVRFTGAQRPETLSVDLHRMAEDPGPALRDGDALFVYYVPDYHLINGVSLIGEVARPGTYPIRVGGDRLSDLLRWAGGFGPRANRADVVLIRPSEGAGADDPELDRLVHLSREQMTESEYITLQSKVAERRNSFRIDWDRMIQGPGRGNLDPLLRSGDIVRVDPLVTTVRVEGQVRHPGLVEYVSGRGVGDYVRLAGGFTDRASHGSIRVTRSETGQVVPAGSVGRVMAGDVIWVPERRDHDPWTLFRDVLTVAGQVAVIVVAVRR